MLVITLGVTGLSSVLLFLYFRNRIGQVEEKVDTVFQLIQNYESNRQPQFTVEENQQPHGYYVQEEMDDEQEYQQQQQQQQNSNPNNDLIAVSDKNSDSESEESDSDSEESDSESEESEEETKQLVLNKDDEENVNDVKVNNVEELDNLELKKENLELESLEEPKTIQIEENHDLDKLKVADLKNLCKEKGLSGYRKLRKNDLINLLSE